jgi:hypothetical protein
MLEIFVSVFLKLFPKRTYRFFIFSSQPRKDYSLFENLSEWIGTYSTNSFDCHASVGFFGIINSDKKNYKRS